ncbi:MAG: TIGR02587 family membrane protein [Actinobacteria bacterium]|nr:TIGR02587 family membrane protein [Actinomycetota bacterium]
MSQTAVPSTRDLLLGVARAGGGAVLFSLPMLMTMELWQFGGTLRPWRIATFVALTLPLLVALARYLGFRDTTGLGWADHLADGLVAYAVGVIASAAILTMIGVLHADRSLGEVVGIVAIESVPASIGAAIGRSQITAGVDRARREIEGYGDEILLMGVGAIVLSFNIAPTDEIPLLALQVGTVRSLTLLVISVVLMHAIVYGVGFRGQHRSDAPVWSVFFGFTLAGYGVALLVSAYLLWLFGRFDDVALIVAATRTVVLALPAALGAAAARLLL